MSIWIFYFVLSSFPLFEIMIFIMRSRQRNKNIIIVKNIETVPKKRTEQSVQNSHEMSKVYPKIKKKSFSLFENISLIKMLWVLRYILKEMYYGTARVYMYVNRKTRI